MTWFKLKELVLKVLETYKPILVSMSPIGTNPFVNSFHLDKFQKHSKDAKYFLKFLFCLQDNQSNLRQRVFYSIFVGVEAIHTINYHFKFGYSKTKASTTSLFGKKILIFLRETMVLKLVLPFKPKIFKRINYTKLSAR